MASVYRKVQGKRAPYYIAYVDESGRRRVVKGCPDKAATERIAAQLETEVALRRRGLIDPRADRYRTHDARPLGEHLAEFSAFVLAKGATAKHADQYLERAGRLFALALGTPLAVIDPPSNATRTDRQRTDAELAHVLARTRLPSLTGDGIQQALATLRDAGRSLQTCNHYRAAARAFARWAIAGGRLRDNPMAPVMGYNPDEDRRHDRRTLSVEKCGH